MNADHIPCRERTFPFHLAPEYVHPLEVGVEEAMRSIISCGSGSTNLITDFRKTQV